MAFYPRNIRIRHAKRRQLQIHIVIKSCPRPVRSSAIMRLDPVVVGVIGVFDSFRADDCPGSRTWHMQLLETQDVKDFCVRREISVIPSELTNYGLRNYYLSGSFLHAHERSASWSAISFVMCGHSIDSS